ncbi:MAG: UPF0182 family protein [Nitrospiraceae bacterium]|jgi:hypothetical protein|nr:UPF0182 family protein [Nitrospiraceae bacterium]
MNRLVKNGPWLLLVLLIGSGWTIETLMDESVDYLWFSSLKALSIFWTYFWARLFSGVIFGSLFFMALSAALRTIPGKIPSITIRIGPRLQEIPVTAIRKILQIAIFLISIFVGEGFSDPNMALSFLSAFKSTQGGPADPVFHHPLSFYLFDLPLIEPLITFLTTILLLSVIVSLILGRLTGFLRLSPQGISFEPAYRKRFLLLSGTAIASLGVSVFLERYDLLTKTHEMITGPGYTETHSTIPALLFTAILAFLTSASCFVAALSESKLLLPLGLGTTAFASYFIGAVIYPDMLERFVVLPDQFHREKPYIEKNIQWTRMSYGLDRVAIEHISELKTPTQQDFEKNAPTINNIRLWDHRPLLTTVRQLQQIRTYYQFPLLAPDRYMVNGQLRQVLLAPRELSYANLPSPNWINLHLAYTHGHGLIMAPVNRVTDEGLPLFWIRNIPPETPASLPLKHSRIYFADRNLPYAIVNTQVGEFDYPSGNKNVYNHYAGTGGIKLSSTMRKILFSYHFGTPKIFLSDAIGPQSRILIHRNIFTIVHNLAPYLTLDPDPVPLVTSDGRLLWMIDAYTTSSHVPYSKEVPGPLAMINARSHFSGGHLPALRSWHREINMIHNPVRIIVDPQSGVPTFYVTDPSDPMIATYRAIFPDLYKPMEMMGPDLQSHLRFPPGIFSILARVYESYHMTDPHTFFNREDLWSLPSRNEEPMSPYYTVMRLPGSAKEEYVLMLPYTPSQRQNLSAWLVGRSDGSHLGGMKVYTFPKERLIYGPDQIEARIDQRGPISKQLTLWNQQGSHVVRGTLLIIPVAGTLLYVEPLYLEATSQGALPELRRVIVSMGDRVVMRKTLSEAINALFENSPVSQKIEPQKREISSRRTHDGWAELHSLEKDADSALRSGDLERLGADMKKILNTIRNHP